VREAGLSRRLQQALRDAGMTVADLAQDDLTPVYIEMIAGGQIRPSLEVLQSLADRLDQPVSCFLEGLPGSRADVLLLLNLATSYLEQEDVAHAQPLLEQAAQFAAEQQDERALGLIQLQFCRLECLVNDFRPALRRGRRALALLRNHGKPKEAIQALIYLGNICSTGRRPKQATGYYQTALAAADGIGEEQMLSLVHYNLGNVLTEVEQWEAAEWHLRKAAESSKLAGTAHETQIEINLALVLREKGQLDRAQERLHKALTWVNGEQRPRLTADIYNDIGMIHAAVGEWEAAQQYYGKTITLLAGHKTRQLAEAHRESARITLKAGDACRACQGAAAALNLADEIQDRLEFGRSALFYGEALIGAGNYRRAHEHLQGAERIFEGLGMARSAQRAADLQAQCCRRRRRFVSGALLLNSSAPEPTMAALECHRPLRGGTKRQ